MSNKEIDKTHVKFVVDGIDARGNKIETKEKIEIQVEGPEKVEAKFERLEGGKIQISFDALVRRGDFSVGVLHRGVRIFFFIIFYYFLLFFIIFYYFLLFFIIFYYFLLFFIIFYYFLLFFIIFYYFLLFF